MKRRGSLLTMGLFCLALPLLAVHRAHGGVLTVEGPMDVVWNGGPSPKITLQIKNASTANVTLVGYQLDLSVEPTLGATGILSFASATIAESNYLFEGNSLFDPMLLVPGTTIDDFMDFPSGAIEEEKILLVGEAYGLITIEFDVTDPLLSGYFHVLLPAFSDEFGPWYLPAGLFADSTYFANAPPGGDPAIVAIIGINVEANAVPEPSSLFLLASGIALLLAGFAWRGAMRR